MVAAGGPSLLPALLWLVFAVLIGVLAWRWFRSMDSDLGRVAVILAALAALFYMTYRIARYYPAGANQEPAATQPDR